MQIVIPMSGVGKRFQDAGYTTPKPLIEVDGKPMIHHIIGNFPGEDKFIFICNNDHLKNTNMKSILEKAVPTSKIIGIEPHKKGPVHAVLEAEEEIDDEEEVIVNYCDFSWKWDYEHFKNFVKAKGCAGCVVGYEGFHPHLLHGHLYAGVRHSKGKMLEIKEKTRFTEDPMQTFHSSGTYYFRSGKLMKKYFAKLVDRKMMVNEEFYVSSVYELFLEDGLSCYAYEIDHMLQWGTPQDLEEYISWSDSFKELAEGKITREEILKRDHHSNFKKKPKITEEDIKNSFEYWSRYFSTADFHTYSGNF